MKHKWKLDKNGLPDDWAWESGFHNGVYCERCGKCVCIHCHQDWGEMDDCEGDEDEPMTNADRIRAMSDEELAENLTYISEVGCPYVARRCKERCIDCFFDWLQEPAEEVDDG